MSIVEHRSCPWVPGSAGRGSRIQAVADPTGAVAGLALHHQECDPGVGAASHTHDFEELITVVEGTAEVWLGEQRQVIAANRLRATFLP